MSTDLFQLHQEAATTCLQKRKKAQPWIPPADLPDILVTKPQTLYPWANNNSSRGVWAMNVGNQIVEAATDYFKPVMVYACFSGGYDSIVPVFHVMQRAERGRDGVLRLDGIPVRVLHINTGIGIEKTRRFVRDTCEAAEWPLDEVRTPESYEDLVLGKVDGYPGGFPGPAMHGFMYQRLKERAIRIAVREAKAEHHRRSTVVFLSGIRHDESKVRTGYARAVSKVGSQVWVNPFYWADHNAFTWYRETDVTPRNPVKETLGMSGECCCGCFAEPGELERVGWACPETKAYIEDLEHRVRAAGFNWGWEDPGPPTSHKARKACAGDGLYLPDAETDYRPMCHNCDKIHMLKVSQTTEEQGELFD